LTDFFHFFLSFFFFSFHFLHFGFYSFFPSSIFWKRGLNVKLILIDTNWYQLIVNLQVMKTFE
jgi:hypothetical protein